MREIHLNGYIDDEEWFGDEITPDALHALLYPPDAEDPDSYDDLRIVLNSYGGSCNAAVRMFDDLRAYPANVHIIVSGTAASAATVLATAADRLEMTQGSLWMIHDPSVAAWGNERDLAEAIQLLRACKESILNVYGRRCRKPREEIGAMMRDTTWLDASAALQDGFIDGIVDMGSGIVNAAFSHETSLAEAKEKVAVWLERSRPKCIRAVARQKDASEPEEPAAEQLEATKPQIEIIVAQEAPQQAALEREVPPEPQPVNLGVPAAQLLRRLELITPSRRTQRGGNV